MMIAKLVTELSGSQLFYFSDWPNIQIPKVCAGVYTIYDKNEHLIYVGMAGAQLTDEKIKAKESAKKESGLYDRLRAHARGYRSGDKFSIYIGDLFVLRELTQADIGGISRREKSFDSYIKDYIRRNLSYRYVVSTNDMVRDLEDYIQVNGIYGEMPTINAKRRERS